MRNPKSEIRNPSAEIRNLSGNANERLMRFLHATPSDSEASFEPFITKAVVAERLDVRLRTVSRLMRRGVLRHYKLGELVRFKWSEVESDVREHFRVSFDPRPAGAGNPKVEIRNPKGDLTAESTKNVDPPTPPSASDYDATSGYGAARRGAAR